MMRRGFPIVLGGERYGLGVIEVAIRTMTALVDDRGQCGLSLSLTSLVMLF